MAAVVLLDTILARNFLSVPQNTFMPLSGHVAAFEDQKYFLETLELCLGKNKESALETLDDCEPTTFVMDLGKKDVILPNALIYDQHTFGYYCNSKMNCHREDIVYICEYNITYAFCNPAQVPVRFSSLDRFVDNNIPLMNVSLVNQTFQWELGTYGILGMSPESQFWTYARDNLRPINTDNQHIQFALGYNFTHNERLYQLDKMIMHTSGWYINSRSVQDDSILIDLPPNSTVWTIPQVKVVRYAQDKPLNLDACVSNVMNNYFYIKDFNCDLKPRILKQLCGNARVCYQSNSVLGDVDNIYIALYRPGNDESRVKVILDPFDFIMFDANNKAVLGIGDVNDDKSSQCPAGTSLILGRLFFSKAWLIIQLNDDNTFRIGLHQQASDYHIFFFMAALVVFHLLMIFLSLLAIRTYKRNSRGYIEARYQLILEGYLKSYDRQKFEIMCLEKSSPQFDLKSFRRTVNFQRGTF
jgi:hypothetical protein